MAEKPDKSREHKLLSSALSDARHSIESAMPQSGTDPHMDQLLKTYSDRLVELYKKKLDDL